MHKIRLALLKLATEVPEIRRQILPLSRQAAGWNRLPPGWTQQSVEKFWSSITGDKRHKVTECIRKMEDKFDNPGAFCGSLADQVEGSTDWRKKKAGSIHVPLKDLPDVFRKALREVSYNKRDIEIKPATSYSLMDSGGDGQKGFAVAVNLQTDQYKITWGSWGGSNAFNPRNHVDMDDTNRTLPPDSAVIKGTSGSYTWAYILIHPSNLQGLLPEDSGTALSQKELHALNILGGIKPGYRAEEFRDKGLGRYSPDNPLIQGLIEKGLVALKGGGLQITTEGKNKRVRMASQSITRVAARYKEAVDIRRVLTPLLDPLQPYVRNYAHFIMVAATKLTEWNTGMSGVEQNTHWKFQSLAEGYKTLAGRETSRQTLWQPAEFEETEVGYPQHIAFDAQVTLDVPAFGKWFVKQLAAPGKEKDMYLAFVNLLHNNEATRVIFKIMANGLLHYWKDKDAWENNTDFVKWISDETPRVSFTFMDIQNPNLNKPKYHLSGRNLLFLFSGDISLGDKVDFEIDEADWDY